MQRNTVIVVVALVAAAAGAGGGYFLAHRSDPKPLPNMPATPAFTPSAAAPGGPNAIAQLATHDGTTAPPVPKAGGLSSLARAVVPFEVRYGAADATRPWDCVALAASKAQEGATVSDPLADAPCGGSGDTLLSGRVRLSTRPTPIAGQPGKSSGIACEATISYTREAGGAKAGKEVRADGTGADTATACAAAVEGLKAPFAAKIAE